MNGDNTLDVYAKNAQLEKDKRPMRNYQGRFVKGHKPLIRPKYELMQKHPKLLCATCYLGCTCPEYQKGCVCTHKREFSKFITRDANDVVLMLQSTTESSLAEMQFAMVQETISGVFSHKVSRLINKNSKRLLLLNQLYEQIDNSKS